MSSFYNYYNDRAVRISPDVIRIIEDKVRERVISVEQCLDADGFRFYFAGVGTIMFGSDYIENLEREVEGRGHMSRNQLERMVMENRLSKVGESQLQPQQEVDQSMEYWNGTVHGTMRGKEFERIIEDEVGDTSESDANRFHRSMKKVYWYRRLKNKLKKELWERN